MMRSEVNTGALTITSHSLQVTGSNQLGHAICVLLHGQQVICRREVAARLDPSLRCPSVPHFPHNPWSRETRNGKKRQPTLSSAADVTEWLRCHV